MCVYACMFGTKLFTKGILLWSQNSIIKATPTTHIGGLRNVQLLPTPISPLPHYDNFMLARSALSLSCSQHFSSMYAGSYVMEDNRIGCSRGK